MLVNVTITGLTPLLMNAYNMEPATTSGGVNKGTAKTPREAAEECAYRLKTGELYIPGPNIYSCIMAAGIYHKIGKRQVTTAKSSLIPSGVFLLEPEIGLGTSHFEVDSRPVVNPSTGGRIVKHRPRLDEWTLQFTLQIEETEFDPKFVRLLVDDAGKKVGLGDFRPQRKGPFGRFVIKCWETQEEVAAR